MEITEEQFTTSVGSWVLRTAEVPPALKDFVATFWEYEGDTPAAAHKIVPRGAGELIFNLGDEHGFSKSFRTMSYGMRERRDPSLSFEATVKRAWISGTHDRPLYIQPGPKTNRKQTHLVAAQLHPWTLYTLFGLPPDGFCNRVIEADDAFDASIENVRSQLAELLNTQQRFTRLAQYIYHRMQTNFHAMPAAAAQAIRLSISSAGDIAVSDLCAELEISRKHLAHLFKTTIGMPPKKYLRLLRFQNVLDHFDQNPFSRNLDAAAEFGFSDEAHFIKDFAAFTDETPGAYFSPPS